jgi:putative transposase
LDETVTALRSRPLHLTTFPYLSLDATYLHVSRTGGDGQVASMAVVIATGVTAIGGRKSWASMSATPKTWCSAAASCAR